MTREDIADKINWPLIVWIVGVANPFIMAPQLYKMWTTMEIAALSLGMLGVILFVQSGFALHGFFIRDRFVMWSNVAAVLMSASTLISVPIIRNLISK